MISAYGIEIASALTDWFHYRVDYDGQNFVWVRRSGLKQVHPQDSILKSVLLGKVETVN